MTPPTKLTVADLPGSERASKFEGREYGSTVSFFLNRHGAGEGPGLHRHPYEETFIVQEGQVTFTVDGETIESAPGDIVVVAAGAAHKFANSGDAPIGMVSIHPADEMSQEWLEE
jgi:quercetin dioxygenase-like cupin family protein